MTQFFTKITGVAAVLASLAAVPALPQDRVSDWNSNGDDVINEEEFGTGWDEAGICDSCDSDDSGAIEEPEFGDLNDDMAEDGFRDVRALRQAEPVLRFGHPDPRPPRSGPGAAGRPEEDRGDRRASARSAAMQLRDALRHRQSEPRSACPPFAPPPERLEDCMPLRVRDTRSPIRDGQANAILRLSDLHRDRTVRAGMGGIANEVAKERPQQVGIARDRPTP